MHYYKVTVGSERGTHETVVCATMVEALRKLAEMWPGVFMGPAAQVYLYPNEPEGSEVHREVLILDMNGVCA